MRVIVLAAWLVVVAAVPSAAQETARVGVVIGYPASLGLLWRPVDRVALRPELSFSQSTTETESVGFPPLGSSTRSSSAWHVGVGVSALFYVSHQESLRTYVSPRFAYARSRSGLAAEGAEFPTGTSVEASGSFGAEHALGSRFSVFGELGLAYAKQTTRAELATIRFETTSHGVSLRSGVGVIFFF